MASDLFFTQLVTQSFSSGSSVGNVSSLAQANRSVNTAGTHGTTGGKSSFESTLQHVSDMHAAGRVSTASGGGQAAPQEPSGQSAAPADISQKGTAADQLLGVSHNNHLPGDDGVFDPNSSSGMNMLMAILNELQRSIMLNNPSGLQLQSGSGADIAIPVFSDTPGTPAGSQGVLEKLEALLAQFETPAGTRLAAEIRNLIARFDALADSDSAKIAITTEAARLIQNLKALSPNGPGQRDISDQSARPSDPSQAGIMALNEKQAAADLAKVLTATTASPNEGSEKIVQQGAAENANSENQAEARQASNRATVLAMAKAASSAESASAQNNASVRTPSFPPEVNANKNGMPGQNEISSLQPDKASDAGFKQDSHGPVLQANPSAQQSDAASQNTKVVHLNTDGASTEALAGKMVNTESGNQENGFSFSGHLQTEIKASECADVVEPHEIVQKRFQAQTLDQIVQKAALNLKDGHNEVQISLKPDYLGHIRMQIMTDSHQVTVRILAELPVVKELIENNAHVLRSELQNHGMDIDQLEVSVSQHSDRQVGDQNKADGFAAKDKTEKKINGVDGELENRAASSIPVNGRNDGPNTKIDFFA